MVGRMPGSMSSGCPGHWLRGSRLAELAKPRVDAGCKPFLGRYPRQEPLKLRPLRRVEGGAERILMFPRHASDLLQGYSPRLSQVERVGAPVGGTVPPLDQTAPLQFIQHRDEAARKPAQLFPPTFP